MIQTPHVPCICCSVTVGEEAITVSCTVRGAREESRNRMTKLWATLGALLGLLSGGYVLNSGVQGYRVLCSTACVSGLERETNCSVLVRRGSSLWWAFVGNAETVLTT